MAKIITFAGEVEQADFSRLRFRAYNARAMQWIYLSPHLDDASFSCGGLIWDQVQHGDSVDVWTIFAGDINCTGLSPFAQSLHENWGTGVETPALRRAEDKLACAVLGAKPRYFDFQDCIYRRHTNSGEPYYASSAAVFGAIHRVEQTDLVGSISGKLSDAPKEANLVVPTALGNHVDHQLVRAAAERLARPLHYYPDYPYVLKNEHLLGYLLPEGSKGGTHSISRQGLNAWQKSIACYRSQQTTFWPEPGSMERDLEEYWRILEGIQLWDVAKRAP